MKLPNQIKSVEKRTYNAVSPGSNPAFFGSLLPILKNVGMGALHGALGAL